MAERGKYILKAAKWVMRAITVVVAAVVLCVIVAAAVLGRQARISIKKEKNNNVKSAYTEYVETVNDVFGDIEVKAAPDMDIVLNTSDDGRCKVSYYNSDSVVHSVRVVDGVLSISCVDDRLLGSDLGFGDDPYITISLPKTRYGSVSIETETGNVSSSAQLECSRFDVYQKSGDTFLSGMTGNNINIRTSSGDVTIATVRTDVMNVAGKSGDFTIMNVDAGSIFASSGDGALTGYNITSGGSALFESDGGDISVEESDAPLLDFESQKGNIRITLLTEKIFKVESADGEISIPGSSLATNQQCTAASGSGNIDIKYAN